MDYALLDEKVKQLQAERLQTRRTYVENVTGGYPETAAGAKRHLKRIDAQLDIYAKARLYAKNERVYHAVEEVQHLENLSDDEMVEKLSSLITISWAAVTEEDLEC